MSKKHRFLLTRDMSWKWFNVLTFGMALGNADSAAICTALAEAVRAWVGHATCMARQANFGARRVGGNRGPTTMPCA